MRYNKIDKVILFGGSLTLVGMAEYLIKEKLKVLIYTSPRHFKEVLDDSQSTLSEKLDILGVEYIVTENINTELCLLSKITCTTLGVGIGEAWNFEKDIIDAFSGRLLDFMGIPLPRYRGGAHYTWMVMRGERNNGMCMQVINTEMRQGFFDSGEIVDFMEYRMNESEKLPLDFFKRELKESVSFLKCFISKINNGHDFKLRSVNEDKSLYLPRLNTMHHGWINWQIWSGLEIDAFIKSFDLPYIGASTRIGNKRIFLRGSKILTKTRIFHPFQSGIVVRMPIEGSLIVATTNGDMEILEVLDEFGNNVISEISIGTRLFTPVEDIDSALQYKADYGSDGLKEKKRPVSEFIKGKNIYLRTLKKTDCSEEYISWLNNSKINKYLETRFILQNKKSIEMFIQEVADSDHSILFGIFRNNDSTHIGNIKIGPINKQHEYADISYFIGDQSAWGCGHATEAVKLLTKYGFDILKLNKCSAGVYSSNTASRKVLEKSGYLKEGRLKSQLNGENGWEDHILYGINKLGSNE